MEKIKVEAEKKKLLMAQEQLRDKVLDILCMEFAGVSHYFMVWLYPMVYVPPPEGSGGTW